MYHMVYNYENLFDIKNVNVNNNDTLEVKEYRIFYVTTGLYDWTRLS